MLTATSSPTTAFLINGIDRAERYCASRSAIGSCDLTTRPEVPHMATRDEGGQTRANRQSEEVEEVEDLDSSDLQERQEKLGKTSTTSSTKSTACSRRMPRILYVSTYRREASD